MFSKGTGDSSSAGSLDTNDTTNAVRSNRAFRPNLTAINTSTENSDKVKGPSEKDISDAYLDSLASFLAGSGIDQKSSDVLLKTFRDTIRFKNELENLFSSRGYENPQVNPIPRAEAGISEHYVLDPQNINEGGKLHCKRPGRKELLAGSVYNEVLIYKILAEYNFGPQESCERVNIGTVGLKDIAAEQSGVKLWIINKDLGDDRNYQDNLHRTFQVKKHNEASNICNLIPEEDYENIDRCSLVLICRLLGLQDVESNPNNFGIQTICSSDKVTKKCYLVDFNVDKYPWNVDKLNQEFDVDSDEQKTFSSIFNTNSGIFEGFYSFKLTPEIRTKTIDTIYGLQGNRAYDIISKSYNALLEQFGIEMLEDDKISVYNYYNQILERFGLFKCYTVGISVSASEQDVSSLGRYTYSSNSRRSESGRSLNRFGKADLQNSPEDDKKNGSEIDLNNMDSTSQIIFPEITQEDRQTQNLSYYPHSDYSQSDYSESEANMRNRFSSETGKDETPQSHVPDSHAFEMVQNALKQGEDRPSVSPHEPYQNVVSTSEKGPAKY